LRRAASFSQGSAPRFFYMDLQVLGDRYELLEPIGRGGMATIYRATDQKMERIVAVKILREMYSSDPKFVLRFQREARAVSALAHPNIVQVFDYGKSGDAYFIVMELIEGADLRKYLRAHGVLDIRRAVVIAHDTALALGAAHRRGIVHRDVKPQNILVNDDALVKLTDFGIATFYRDIDNERLTTTGMTLGTVQYYAPEQAQGEIVQPAADVYALGIVLYEMLVGHPPFDGDTPVAIAVRHIQEPPVRPSRYNPNIPPALERVILRCLEKDPRDRYRDGDALAYALETWDKPRQSQGRMSAPVGAVGPGNAPGVRSPSGPSGNASRQPSGPRGGNGGMGGNVPPYAGDYEDAGMSFNQGPTRADVAAGTLGRTGAVIARPDEEQASPVAGITTAIVVASILLILGISCFAVFKLTGFGEIFNASTPPPTVSQNVSVPNYVGQLYTNASKDAINKGLVLTVTKTQEDATHPAGTILTQDQQPNASVAKGTVINVVVSSLPGQKQVPDVHGLSYTGAYNAIKALGFTPVRSSDVFSDQPIGLVDHTTPTAGTPEDPGTVVQISVSKGLAVTPTPTNGPVTPTATSGITPTATSGTTPTPTATTAPTATTSTTPIPPKGP